MAKNIECKCTYNFTCGHCMRNKKPWFWTDSSKSFSESNDEWIKQQKRQEEGQ